MNENNYFLKHRTSILIILVVIFVGAGLLLWRATLKNAPGSNGHTLTPEEIQAIINDRPTGSSTLSVTQKKAIQKDRPTSTSTLTAEQRERILNDKPKQN